MNWFEVICLCDVLLQYLVYGRASDQVPHGWTTPDGRNIGREERAPECGALSLSIRMASDQTWCRVQSHLACVPTTRAPL